jgi:uncharacterized protein (PEP-CTERM system associated)
MLRLRVLSALAMAAAAAGAVADWRGAAGVSGSVVFSDNIFLSSDATQSGSIFRLRPYVSTSRRGNRINSRLDYGPALLWSPDDSDLNDVQHTLQASLDAELIERYFFLDVRATANQVLIDPRVNTRFESLGRSDAFTQQASLTVTPRIVLPVVDGRFATVRIEPGLGYTFTAASDRDDDALRTPTRDTRVSSVSGPMFTNVPWSMNWRRRVFDAEDGEGFGSFDTRVGYIFSPKYRLDLILGYDDGGRSFRATDGSTSGVRWETRFVWTPVVRAQLELGVGQSFYADIFRLRGSYRHKRWAFRTTYDVSVENFATLLQQERVVATEDLFGEPIDDPFLTNDVLFATVTTPVLVEETFLNHRFELGAQYQKGRNSASASWFVADRDYSESDRDTRDNRLQLAYSRRLSSRLSGNAAVNLWQHQEDADSSFDYTQDALDLGLSYQFGRRTRIGARIGRLNRDGDAPGLSFTENRFTMDFNFRL